jgi:hypothetical protein
MSINVIIYDWYSVSLLTDHPKEIIHIWRLKNLSKKWAFWEVTRYLYGHILVYKTTVEGHDEFVREVLKRLQNNNMRLNLNKVQFL